MFKEQEGSHHWWSGVSKGETKSESKEWSDCIGLIVHDVFLLCLRWEATGKFEQSSDMI